MNLFNRLDESIIKVILEFMNYDSIEKNTLLNSCSILRKCKREYFSYKLNKEYSIMYIHSYEFRKLIDSNIKSRNQISIDLSNNLDIRTISNKNGLNGLHKINISHCTHLQKVKIYNVHSIIASHCSQLTTIKLCKVLILDVSYCPRLYSGLYTWKNVDTLHITNSSLLNNRYLERFLNMNIIIYEMTEDCNYYCNHYI